jgi:hypothetical protein
MGTKVRFFFFSQNAHLVTKIRSSPYPEMLEITNGITKTSNLFPIA